MEVSSFRCSCPAASCSSPWNLAAVDSPEMLQRLGRTRPPVRHCPVPSRPMRMRRRFSEHCQWFVAPARPGGGVQRHPAKLTHTCGRRLRLLAAPEGRLNRPTGGQVGPARAHAPWGGRGRHGGGPHCAAAQGGLHRSQADVQADLSKMQRAAAIPRQYSGRGQVYSPTVHVTLPRSRLSSPVRGLSNVDLAPHGSAA